MTPITLSPEVSIASIKQELRDICPDSVVRIHEGTENLTVNIHCGDDQGVISHEKIHDIVRKLSVKPFKINYLPI